MRALERDPIRFSNFHLITALIKANRSERKRQFHYSELTVVAKWSKDIWSGRNPTLAFTIPAVLIAEITAPFDPEKFRFPADPRDSARSSNSSVVNDNNRIRRSSGFFLIFDRGRKRKWRDDDSVTVYLISRIFPVLVTCVLPGCERTIIRIGLGFASFFFAAKERERDSWHVKNRIGRAPTGNELNPLG